jgi:putative membrane protein
MHGADGMWFGMGWGWIIGIIVLALIIWLIVRGAGQGSATPQSSDKSALDILKERYAKGEINKEEFEEKKKDLS